ncbi:MAG: hypothetical protein AB1791_12725 [Chloroflexota bacterium]
MAANDIVRSLVDGREYLLGPFLKAGLIGAVYPAVSMDSERTRVAVKLPAPGLNSEGLARFRQEDEVMEKLADKLGQPLLIPWVQKGENKTSGGEALILQYVGEETLLAGQLPSPEQPLAREVMALRAAADYARLLEALHSLNYTCQDRKLTDLRWLDDQLVVLDWNVVEDNRGAAGRADDLYLFAVLWYQLLAGRYPLANLNPLDDALWRDGRVSYGTRRLLVKALTPALTDRYPTAEALRAALTERLQTVTKPPAALLSEARPLFTALQHARAAYDRAIRYGGANLRDLPFPDLEQEWRALDLFDLAYRQGDQSVLDERDESLRFVGSQGERLALQMEQAFRLTRYDLGAQAAEWAEAIANQSNDLALRLRVARWRLLIRAGQQVMEEGLQLRPVREALSTWLHEVEQATPATRPEEWEQWRQRLARIVAEAKLPASSRTAALLDDLKYELQARAAVARAKQLEFEGDYEKAIEQLPGAIRGREGVKTYQELLGRLLPDLEHWRHTLEERARAKKVMATFRQTIADFQQRLKEMREEVETAEPAQFETTSTWAAQVAKAEKAEREARQHPDSAEHRQRVLRLAFPLWADRQNEAGVRQLGGRSLIEVSEVAQRQEDSGLLAGDRFARPILEELQALRRQWLGFSHKEGNPVNPTLEREIEQRVFAGLDERLRRLKERDQARQKILEYVSDSKWKEAIEEAGRAKVLLFEDPLFSEQTAQYWRSVEQRVNEVRQNASRAINEAQQAKEQAETAAGRARDALQEANDQLNQMKAQVALLQADNALLELNLAEVSKRAREARDASNAPWAEQWRGELRQDYEWLSKKSDLLSYRSPWRMEELIKENPSSRLARLWQQRHAPVGGMAAGDGRHRPHYQRLASLLKELERGNEADLATHLSEWQEQLLRSSDLYDFERAAYQDVLYGWQHRLGQWHALRRSLDDAEATLSGLGDLTTPDRDQLLVNYEVMGRLLQRLVDHLDTAPPELLVVPDRSRGGQSLGTSWAIAVEKVIAARETTRKQIETEYIPRKRRAFWQRFRLSGDFQPTGLASQPDGGEQAGLKELQERAERREVAGRRFFQSYERPPTVQQRSTGRPYEDQDRTQYALPTVQRPATSWPAASSSADRPAATGDARGQPAASEHVASPTSERPGMGTDDMVETMVGLSPRATSPEQRGETAGEPDRGVGGHRIVEEPALPGAAHGADRPVSEPDSSVEHLAGTSEAPTVEEETTPMPTAASQHLPTSQEPFPPPVGKPAGPAPDTWSITPDKAPPPPMTNQTGNEPGLVGSMPERPLARIALTLGKDAGAPSRTADGCSQIPIDVALYTADQQPYTAKQEVSVEVVGAGSLALTKDGPQWQKTLALPTADGKGTFFYRAGHFKGNVIIRAEANSHADTPVVGRLTPEIYLYEPVARITFDPLEDNRFRSNQLVTLKLQIRGQPQPVEPFVTFETDPPGLLDSIGNRATIQNDRVEYQFMAPPVESKQEVTIWATNPGAAPAELKLSIIP